MGQNECTAVRALHDVGSRELPVGRTSLVTTLSGHFSFRDCHVDTSSSDAVLSSLSYSFLFIQKLLQYSHSWIAWFSAIARSEIQVRAACRAQACAVLPAEALRLHIQNEASGKDFVQIDGVAL